MSESNMQGTVLIVDDEETILKMAGQRLRHAGYRVLTAPNGTLGLVLAKAEHPDAILLDMMMPSMNGTVVLQTLKGDRQTKDIPVIMLTAVGDEGNITGAIASGAVCYLVKPYQAKELLDEVAMAVERHRISHGRVDPYEGTQPSEDATEAAS